MILRQPLSATSGTIDPASTSHLAASLPSLHHVRLRKTSCPNPLQRKVPSSEEGEEGEEGKEDETAVAQRPLHTLQLALHLSLTQTWGEWLGVKVLRAKNVVGAVLLVLP